MSGRPDIKPVGWAGWFRRGPWENAATAIIAVGVVMLCQPLSLDIYSYSFLTILVGTLMFIVVTKFPR